MQLRVAGMGGPFGLDFGAVMQMGAASGADLDLLASALPAAERAIVTNFADQSEDAQ